MVIVWYVIMQVGMCHVSEVADHYVKNIEKHYKVGDRVRARILKMDEGNERISLGLKESYFPELGDEMEPQSEGEAPDEVIQSNAGTRIKTIDDVMADKDEDIEGDENEEKEEDSEEESGETEEGTEDDEESDEADVEPDVMLGSRSLVAPPLDVQLDRDLTSSGAHTKDENGEDAAEEDTEEAKKLNRRAKKRIKEEREAEIRAAEEKRLRGDQAPETLDDFEALVRASPNSSFVWIKYMAFLIQLADIDKARAIAERFVSSSCCV
jgi:rRNA biogenesis protein RRP5